MLIQCRTTIRRGHVGFGVPRRAWSSSTPNRNLCKNDVRFEVRIFLRQRNVYGADAKGGRCRRAPTRVATCGPSPIAASGPATVIAGHDRASARHAFARSRQSDKRRFSYCRSRVSDSGHPGYPKNSILSSSWLCNPRHENGSRREISNRVRLRSSSNRRLA